MEGLFLQKHEQTRLEMVTENMQSLWLGVEDGEVGGDAGWMGFQLNQAETGNQDKLTLNSSTSSSCKQEA